MVFSSFPFLCIFLPAVLLLCSWNSIRWQNGVLIAASLLFYAYGEPVYVFLMLASICVNYALGLLCGSDNPKTAKAGVIAAVAANLACLAVFKYSGFLVESINTVFHSSLPVPQIALPIGISFFTFQAMSYVIDVYRKDVPAQKNIFAIMLYISFFPQLIAGPIVKYHDVQAQIENRSRTWEKSALGIRRFCVGLAKKVLIANLLASGADSLYALPAETIDMTAGWLMAVIYLFQIYFDFSGYSDMAIGLGLLFGFHFRENFNYPYISTSIQEFWRRWHISLSSWFKEYLYIPLGGNRRGKWMTIRNKLIVFFCTGLWHGANLTFIVWGLWHGFWILAEEYLHLKKLPKALGWVLTFLIVLVGFVFFRADSLSQAGLILSRMFAPGPVSLAASSAIAQVMTPMTITALAAACIGSLPLIPWMKEKLPASVCAASYPVSLILLLAVILQLAGGGYNPFIYFRF